MENQKYVSIFENLISTIRRPLIYLTIAASAATAYADSRLSRGKDAELADYLQNSPAIVRAVEERASTANYDKSKALEALILAVRKPEAIKETFQKDGYTEFNIIIQGGYFTLALPKDVGSELEKQIGIINNSKPGSNQKKDDPPQTFPYQKPKCAPIVSGQSKEYSEYVANQSEYDRIFAERIGKSGQDALRSPNDELLGGLLGWGFGRAIGHRGLLSSHGHHGRHHADRGGSGGGGGGGQQSSGFHYGGTGATPPLPGGGNR